MLQTRMLAYPIKSDLQRCGFLGGTLVAYLYFIFRGRGSVLNNAPTITISCPSALYLSNEIHPNYSCLSPSSALQIFIAGGPFDMKRFITLSIFGFIYHGPSGHYFYNWLDSKVEGTDAKAVFTKVAIDQVFWCPIFMSVFFAYLGLVNGDGFAAIGSKIRNDLLSACQGSWKVWPIVHAVNFKFISNKHRLVFINGVQIAFNMFLSIIGTKS